MKIICTLPNASEEMNGVAFKAHLNGGMISVEDVSEQDAKLFLSIPGFEVVEEKAPAASTKKGATKAQEPVAQPQEPVVTTDGATQADDVQGGEGEQAK